jgi:hypothetical protein
MQEVVTRDIVRWPTSVTVLPQPPEQAFEPRRSLVVDGFLPFQPAVEYPAADVVLLLLDLRNAGLLLHEELAQIGRCTRILVVLD